MNNIFLHNYQSSTINYPSTPVLPASPCHNSWQATR